MFKIEPVQHGVVDAKQTVAGRTAMLRARQITQDRDGLTKALVAFFIDTSPIHSDWVQVDKANERHSFANALYGTKYTDGLLAKDICSKFEQAVFEQDMMLWSRALWPAFIGASAGGYAYGDEEPSAPHWAVPGLVLDGLTSIWFGDREANKSTLQRMTAVSLNSGVYSVIPVKGQEPAGWVNAEEDPSEHTRQLGNVNAALGLDRNSRLYTIHARGMHIEDLAQRLEKAIREEGLKHIFVDSLSRLARGMNLNENQTANLLMDSLGGLGPSVNWIGHTGQENAYRLAGSRHFENAARLMVRVQSRQSIGGVSADLKRGVRATVTKANGAPRVASMFWTLDYHRDFGLMEARFADPDEWPVLHCDAMTGEVKRVECRRKTWDGVLRNGGVRCARHRGEDDEE